MCGRYLIANEDSGDLAEINRIVEALNAKYYGAGGPKLKTGEIFPTDDAPVIMPCAAGNAGVTAEAMKWGFPKWSGSGVIINARSESAQEKKTFAEPLARRRCVIPSSGYFEWKTESKDKKTKYLFRLPGTKALYMAGLFTEGRFVILTTAANAHVSDVHTRMPVVLRESEIESWLYDSSYIGRAFDRSGIVLEKYAV